ncbi:hypothetical protein [Occultella kanbiaonis]|uniref:hypothetical protein n=1 Tax=Occultella kanbiaonis TaxID=2675754 RepID=UPI0013D8A25C|nr:hypothetical protein [Occultella kanbiaonis]
MSTSARIRHRRVPVPSSPQLERDRAEAGPADTPADQRQQAGPATAKAGPAPALRPR